MKGTEMGLSFCWRCGLRVDEPPTGSNRRSDQHENVGFCIDMLRNRVGSMLSRAEAAEQELDRVRNLLADAERLLKSFEPVKFAERQPQDYQSVLAYMPLPGYGWMRFMFRQGVPHPYTHWMPLPDDPEAALDAAGGAK